jgi:hypothetical protein
MLRNVGAVLAGLVVGMVVNMVVVQVNTAVLFPAPAGTDLNDPAQLSAFLATLPVGAWLVVVLAHLLQAFVGGLVAARLGTAPIAVALVVGALSALGGLAALVMIAAPAWMWLELPLYFAAAWAAGALEVRRRAHRGG